MLYSPSLLERESAEDMFVLLLQAERRQWVTTARGRHAQQTRPLSHEPAKAPLTPPRMTNAAGERGATTHLHTHTQRFRLCSS